MGQRPSASRTKRDRSLDRFVLVCAGLCALTVLGVVVLVFKASGLRSTPAWWEAAMAAPVGSQDSAAALENRVSSALTRVRAQDELDWQVAIEEADINAWVVHRLRDTVETHLGEQGWPNELDSIRVLVASERITVGARLEHEHGATLVWATVSIAINEQGRFDAKVRKAYIGTTRVPVSWARSVLGPDKLGAARLDLGDGREVIVRAVRAGDHRIEFALRTQQAGAS